MKTVEEIKQTVAENRGYESWEELVEDYIYHGHHKRLDMSIEGVVNIYASQYKAKVKVLEAKVEIYKELLEKFVPIDRWDEASALLSKDGCGLAEDFYNKERERVRI